VVTLSSHNPNTVGYTDNNVSQHRDPSHISFDNGTNMGFVAACGPAAMGYWDGSDLPFYYSLASQFPIGDRYFCSVMGPTYPNRRFLIAATALGDVTTDAGFRVPVVVVSPWSKRNHVSHAVYDHTSILKLIETKWNLPALTYRDANARDMLDFLALDAARPPFAEPPTLAAPLNPFTGPLRATSLSAGFHPIATAVPGSGPAPDALVETIPTDTDALIARHTKRALASS